MLKDLKNNVDPDFKSPQKNLNQTAFINYKTYVFWKLNNKISNVILLKIYLDIVSLVYMYILYYTNSYLLQSESHKYETWEDLSSIETDILRVFSFSTVTYLQMKHFSFGTDGVFWWSLLFVPVSSLYANLTSCWL